MIPKDSRRGFTLIELLFSLAVLMIIAAGTFKCFMLISNMYERSFDLCNSKFDRELSLKFVKEEIRNATSISVNNGVMNADGKKIYIKDGILRFDTDSGQIAASVNSINVSKYDASGKLYKVLINIDGINYTEYVYRRQP